MTSQTDQHILFNEPSVVVNVSQIEVEADVLHLPYPPELSLKRRLSETLKPRWKRRKKSEAIHSIPVHCPCSPPPAYLDANMSEPWSNLDSAYSTLSTSPPSPITPATEHPRRLSVSEFVEKLNAKLRRMFGSRRGSAEDEHPPTASNEPLPLASNESPPLAPFERRRSSVSEHFHGPTEPPNLQPTYEQLLWGGDIALPNVSLYFECFGEPGPISYYTTADWDIFQATLQAQRRNSTRAEMHRDMYYEADADVEMSERLRKHSTRSSGQKRKDSHFSFSDLWAKSRRSSKVDKAEVRQLSEDEVATGPRKESIPHSIPEHEVVLPLTEIGVLPRASTDGTSLLIPKESLTIPEADFSSSRSSIPSLKFSLPSSPKSAKPAPTPSPNAQPSIRLVTKPPPFGRPEVRPGSSIDSSPSSTSLSSVNSNSPDAVDSPTTALRPRRTESRLVRHRRAAAGAISSGVGVGVEGRRGSLPIAIPQHSSPTTTSSTAHPTTHYYTLTTTGISITECSGPSTPSLSRHGDRAPPSSPPLGPTFIPSPEQMQALNLGPPEHSLFVSEGRDGSSERIFNVSVEGLLAQNGFSGGGEDEMDVGMIEGGSAVRRRTGTNLRKAYVEHGSAVQEKQEGQEEDEKFEAEPPERKISPRKSVGQRCWWGADGSSASAP